MEWLSEDFIKIKELGKKNKLHYEYLGIDNYLNDEWPSPESINKFSKDESLI